MLVACRNAVLRRTVFTAIVSIETSSNNVTLGMLLSITTEVIVEARL
jgi:hypothetical protein